MNRRNFIVTATTVASAAIAGCGDPPERTIDDIVKIDVWISEGESFGYESGAEEWKFMLSSINDGGTIDVMADKTIPDEVGQNKEGTDSIYLYKRGDIEEGTITKFENDVRMAYFEHDGSEVHVGVDDEYLSREYDSVREVLD